ncbi:MAG: homocysteine S-methyltransferase family protein [Candidatus Nanopelagicales bacterium]
MTDDLLTALSRRVVIADGATGTMLQAHDLSLDDFEGHEGCNEVLNVTRPDVVRSLHEAFFDVGVDAVETNTFGANLANLAEYGIQSRIRELAQAGAQIAADTARGLQHQRPPAICPRFRRSRHQTPHTGPRTLRGLA